MKKIFSVLMVAFAMTAMVACGDKDNDNNRSGGDSGPVEEETNYVPGGLYMYEENYYDQGGHFLSWAMQFYDESDFTILTYVYDPDEGGPESDTSMTWSGEYRYNGDAGEGTVESLNQGVLNANRESAEFHYHNEVVTLKFRGEPHTLTKKMDW